MAQQYFKTGQSGCHSICAGISFLGGGQKEKERKNTQNKNKKERNPLLNK
jgi:hypothetical protein